MSANHVLEEALRQLERQSAEVARELEKAFTLVTNLQAESNRLDAARQGLRAVIDPTYEPPTPAAWRNAVMHDAVGRRVSAKATTEATHRWLTQLAIDTAAGEDAAASTLPERPRTADAVRMILEENREIDVHIDVIRHELTQRGWVSPDSKAPNAMIYQAARRLADDDPHVVRTSRRTWRFVSDPATVEAWEDDKAHSEVGDDDAT